MIVNCEACQKRYLVDETVLGVSGRALKCSSCGHRWHQMPPRPEKDLAEALVAHNDSDSVDTSRKSWFSLFFLIILLIAVFLGGGFFAKESVMKTWPETKKIYSMVGVTPSSPVSNLVLKNVMPLDLSEASSPSKKIVIRGDFFNPTDQVENLSTIVVKIEGGCEQAPWLEKVLSKTKGFLTKEAQACVVSSWTHNLVETRVLPGGHMTFETEAKELPQTAQKIQIYF